MLPTLPPDWISAPLTTGETAHYVRVAKSGPNDVLTTKTHVCKCDVSDVLDEISSSALSTVPDGTVSRSNDTACGRPVEHLVVTGLADGVTRTNLDVFAYRTPDEIVLITLYFTQPNPRARDEAAMRAICPPVPAPEPS